MTTRDANGARSAGLDRRAVAWLVGWGLLVWAVVTAAVRLVGPALLSPASGAVVPAFFAAVVPLMAAVTYPVYRRLGVAPAGRPAAAALMSLPGMGLDVLLVAFAPVLLPAMGPGAVRNFGAILLFGYAVVLLTGFLGDRD